MNTISALIVDDERNAGEALEALLELYCPEVVVCTKCLNLTDAARKIGAIKPDLVFLDIAVGKENGFDLLKMVDVVDFQIVFTTAYSEFAIKAFKVNAIDYLLKPINPEELTTAIGKVNSSNESTSIDFQAQIANLSQLLNDKKQEKITISTLEGLNVISIENILHINGSGNYSTFYLKCGNKIMASKSLKHFEQLLPLQHFFRSHQSHLVNLSFIKKILSQDAIIQLSNDTFIPMAQSRKSDLLEKLKEYIK